MHGCGAHPDFVGVLLASGADDRSAALALHEDVSRRYGEPHRRYHTLAHVVAVADGVATLAAASGLGDPRAALLAAWLHDVVYDTHNDGNEDASAEYAVRALSVLGVDPKLVQRCSHLVRVTSTHLSTALDERVLCDADLAILAAEPDRYRAYARAVRAEYAWVGAEDFRAGRAAILRGLLARDALYRTASAAGWEAAARANIADEIRELSSTG